MPPIQLPSPITDTDHLLARPKLMSGGELPTARKQPAGPIVGIVIILILTIIGALYFWGAYLNRPSAGSAPSPITQN